MPSDLTIVYGGMLEEAVGAGAGLPAAALERAAEDVRAAHASLRAKRDSGRIGFFDLPAFRTGLDEVLAVAADLRKRYENLLVLGIGGSALGATALVRALTPPFTRGPGMRVVCLDNVDPVWFGDALKAFPPDRTAFLVVSKSGSTPETMSQYLIVKRMLSGNVLGNWTDRMVYITDPEKGPLRADAKAHGARSFSVPGNVGGRFSVLSPVGLLPAACAGIDVRALLDGAARAQERCDGPELMENPGYLLGTLLHLADRSLGLGLHVLMPYRQGLWETAFWFRQLWAESLGKNERTGPTPIAALGATDQHSQMQLYMEGPKDKVVTFLEVEDHGTDVAVPKEAAGGLAHLGGGGLGGLLHAELLGSRAALLEAGRPVLTVRLPRLDAGTLGALLQTFMVATALAGELYGIDAFDQPGVEAGKVNAAALLGKAGLEEKAVALRTAAEEIERHRV